MCIIIAFFLFGNSYIRSSTFVQLVLIPNYTISYVTRKLSNGNTLVANYFFIPFWKLFILLNMLNLEQIHDIFKFYVQRSYGRWCMRISESSNRGKTKKCAFCDKLIKDKSYKSISSKTSHKSDLAMYSRWQEFKLCMQLMRK